MGEELLDGNAVARRILIMDSRWVSISEGLLTNSLKLVRVREESFDSTHTV